MATIYSPLLLITAALETKQAHQVRKNHRRGAEDDDTIEEWEQLTQECDFEADGWAKKVERTKPNVDIDSATRECMELRSEVAELKRLLEQLIKGKEVEKNGVVDGESG
jgi:hypothetical protein